jgi:hypothetical protein
MGHTSIWSVLMIIMYWVEMYDLKNTDAVLEYSKKIGQKHIKTMYIFLC